MRFFIVLQFVMRFDACILSVYCIEIMHGPWTDIISHIDTQDHER